MTKSCVFCKTPNVDYTCCLSSGCKMCECCYKELFVETKYGFAPRNPRFNWHNCPECMREIMDLTLKTHESSWQEGNAGLTYSYSSFDRKL